MSVQTLARTPVITGLPRVNLLPPEIAERRRFRQVQAGLGGAVVVALGVVGLLYTHAHSGAVSAQSDLDQAQADRTRVQAQVTALQNVSMVYQQVAQRQAMLAQAMGDEIRWSKYLNNLSLRMPDNVWLTSLNLSETTTKSGSTAATTPSTGKPAVATITFAGTAFSHDDVATWLESLAKEPAYTNPYLSNSTEALVGTKKTVNFSSTVSVTSDAYSNRYTKRPGS